MMNIAVLALVTALIFAEKLLPLGRQIAYAAGAGLIAYGAVVVFVPEALPMTMDEGHAMTEMEGMESMDDEGTMQGDMEMGGSSERDGGAMDDMSNINGTDGP
jgi:hypothetical protein